MSASEINGLAGFIQRSFYENAAVTNFLSLPLLPIGGANLRGTPNLWAGMA